jgi:hypothetical protein
MDQRKQDVVQTSTSTSTSTLSLLAQERRTHVDTASAAYYLGRKPQTMRVWASTETGPVRPVRVNGRLAWPVAEIRAVLQLPAPLR